MRFCDELLYFTYSVFYSNFQNKTCVSVNTEKYLSKHLPKIFEENLKDWALQFFRVSQLLCSLLLCDYWLFNFSYHFRFSAGDLRKKTNRIYKEQMLRNENYETRLSNDVSFHYCSMLCLAARIMFSLSSILSEYIIFLTCVVNFVLYLFLCYTYTYCVILFVQVI